MFRRESARERTLLRLLEQQVQLIRDLNDRLMHATDRTWTPPPTVPAPAAPAWEPPAWTATPEQDPVQ